MTPRKAAVLLLALLLGTCNKVLVTAPPGSTFAGSTLTANPEFIAAHGDVSVISGLLIKATGSAVEDGTVVQFFTNLGKIDPTGQTKNGVVRVNLVSDSRSGKATVTAFSGGGLTAAPSPSPSTASAGSPVAGFASSMSVTGASAVSATAASATVTVTIGSALPDHLSVTANPQRITSGRTASITAHVFDANGNPVANIPVFFTIQSTTGTSLTERLDSGGRQLFTDNDGRVEDRLRTSYDPTLPPKTTTVAATTANNKTNTVVITIN
jgi:hypothetical protein